MRGGDELRVGRELVAAGLGFLERRLRERREAIGGVARGRRARPRPRPAAASASGSSGGPSASVATLTPRRVDVAGAVGGAVVVDPAGRVGPRGAAVEEEQLLARDLELDDGRRTGRASQPPQLHTIRSASSTVPSSSCTVPASGVARERTTRAPRAAACAASVCTARCARRTPASGSCRTQARSSTPSDGNSAAASSTDEPLRRDAEAGQRRARTRASQPSSRCANQLTPHSLHQVGAGLGLELAPQRAGAARHRRVVGVGAVRAADQARLAARRRARVAGLELVDQHDLVAAPRQRPRQRRAERPRSHDHDPHATNIKGQTL